MTDVPSTLDPRGPAAADIAALWWFMLGLGAVVFTVVVVCLVMASRSRPPEGARRYPAGRGIRFIALWGIAIPAVVLTVLMALGVAVGLRTQAAPSEPAVTVEVVGHTFWWEVRYPDHQIITANEIHVPAGEPVRLEVSSADVIHAFWVPQLHGKVDLIPGHVNQFWIQADQAGEYRGICAEYCGIQHAQMHLVVVASPRQDFERWVQQREAPPPSPDKAFAGRDVFAEANCIACHTVHGATAETGAGPDLTDLAARRTLAAGMLDNNRENLAAWIQDPQSIKPGARMPPTPLNSTELEALLDYLETLEPEEVP